MTTNQQIDDLNSKVKVRIAPSPIHGVGLFALRDISKGQRLYADNMPALYSVPFSQFQQLFPGVRQLLLERWPNIVNGSKFLYPDTRIQAYINHADEPNYDPISDMVLKDIKKGEEITENYRFIPGSKTAHPWLDDKQSK